MIDYLKKFNITDDDLNIIKKRYNDNFIKNFEVMSDNVDMVLTTLKDYGVINLIDVVLYRPDICFKDVDYLKEELKRYDHSLLTYVFNGDIKDLINFDI